MTANPWARLPSEPPYVLSEDKGMVEKFNRTAAPNHFLHVDKLLPEPFIGARDAPVILLSNNPGFSEDEEREGARQSAAFRELVRRNLLHESSDYPFVFLHPDVGYRDGKEWWQDTLKPLLRRFWERNVSRSILNVVYFPYPSARYRHQRRLLISQEYGFELVRDAINRQAIVVLMRRGRRKAWLTAVPELNGYSHLFSVRSQNPVISPNNCDGYSQVEKAIATFLAGKERATPYEASGAGPQALGFLFGRPAWLPPNDKYR